MSIKYNDFTPDSVVQTIIERFVKRAKFGEKKYGTNLDRVDLKDMDYLQHLQEELMDAILYLEKYKTIKKDLDS